MNGKGQTYRYCSNPQCGFRRICFTETGFDAVYAVKAAVGKTGGQCPYCEAPLASVCPGCGRPATSRPLLFCPACGADLVGGKRETHCAFCGKPMRIDSTLQGDVPCCSERCLRDYLLQHVKTCDQCGRRFKTGETNDASFIELALQGQGNRKFDFCSTGCLEKYSAEHGILLHSALTANNSMSK
jgi:hypothetical protein